MIHLKNQERLINKLFSSEKFLATVIYRYASIDLGAGFT